MKSPTPTTKSSTMLGSAARATTMLRLLAVGELAIGSLLIALLQSAPHAWSRQLNDQQTLEFLPPNLQSTAAYMTATTAAFIITPAIALLFVSPAIRTHKRPATLTALSIVTLQAVVIFILACRQLIATLPNTTPAQFTCIILAYGTPLALIAHTARLLARAWPHARATHNLQHIHPTQ